MFRFGKLILSTGFVFLMLVTTAIAQPELSVGLKAGTMGIGAEVATSINKDFNARLSGTFFSYKNSGVHADSNPSIAYNTDLNITSIGALVDYFPFEKEIKVSAGLFYHDFSVNGDAIPDEPYTLDGKTFQPDELGSLSANVDYKSKIVPYAGIGFGNPLADGSRFKFNFEIGTVYTNSPRVTMQGDGMIAPTAQQDQSFEDGLSEFKFYPVLNIGLSYRL